MNKKDVFGFFKKLIRLLKEERDKNSPSYQSLIAIIKGVWFFLKPKLAVEDKAKKRFENYCRRCPFFQDEVYESEKVEDERIPELSGKMCSDCGCTLSFKTRQNVKKCKKWKD